METELNFWAFLNQVEYIVSYLPNEPKETFHLLTDDLRPGRLTAKEIDVRIGKSLRKPKQAYMALCEAFEHTQNELIQRIKKDDAS
ncbi:hypothetical protein [Candidatus Enterococcus courvalinii]|uniref:Uncharacterized protein n=1 Tax=Candidatus Enterococcus courvalinii TaxID=2815329 RepID=A0ABS3I0H0_9ENTE|nr:hypothetical protein [Enterococcus sp. MSG2901]MBO0481815.1 hypothetical protein [Enterococcus sp. MSG2901]